MVAVITGRTGGDEAAKNYRFVSGAGPSAFGHPRTCPTCVTTIPFRWM